MALTPQEKGLLTAQAAQLIGPMRIAQGELLKHDPDPKGRPRFAQLPPTHTTVPAADAAPNNLDAKMGHRMEGWPEALAEGATVPATLRGAFEVHEYLKPSRVEHNWGTEIVHTPGWLLIGQASDGVTVYWRVFGGDGPEQRRTTTWEPVEA